jgi:hypothetical protein
MIMRPCRKPKLLANIRSWGEAVTYGESEKRHAAIELEPPLPCELKLNGWTRALDVAAADEEEPDEALRPYAAADARPAAKPHFEPPPLDQEEPDR